MKEYTKIEALKSSLIDFSDRYSQIKILSEYLLNHLGASSVDNSKSTKKVVAAYKGLYKKHSDFVPEIPDNTFIVLLSKIANEQGSQINCPGKKQGYYLEKLVQQLEKIEESEKQERSESSSEADLKHESKFQEKDVYPILKDWLFEKDFDRVANTSNLRKNGKWGNPDLVGLKIEDIYGRPDIEITTIEVKLTEDNWEQWVFEAVAHTRFSNRSYFSFLYPDNLINKLDSTDLKLYAEHFGIGILVIEIDGQEYVNIKEKKSMEIDYEKIRIVEYHQAPHTQTNIKFRKKFLKALDILDLNKLYRFGEELE